MPKNSAKAPVITVDGPSGSGKGTISQRIAKELKWHFLDSGVLYRVLALGAQLHHIDEKNEPALAKLASHLDVQFIGQSVFFEGTDVTNQIRSEACGNLASIVSAYKTVRAGLIDRQRAFRESPGLVTDGRDMGTVIFPDAEFKVFLDASLEARAKRRFLQLQEKGINDSLERVLAELALRDKRDRDRVVAPLKPADDAWVLDTTLLSIEETFSHVMDEIQKRFCMSEVAKH
ncbi:MAG: (d)CMP kinase [Gammaproteobacteria bacterium]|nr:(d)CMP kinase [Gammaproteobacteria bacterium]